MNLLVNTPPGWRGSLARRIEAPRSQAILIALILLNAVTLCLETNDSIMAKWGDALIMADRLILTVFVFEIGIRLIVWRGRFFRDPWSVFDFVVVGVALIPATGPLAGLRALRVLRVLRLISTVPSMRRVAGGLLAAIPGLGSVVGIIAAILYVFAVISTKLFADDFPQWFGSLSKSAYTLFQIMTLESWSMSIVRPIMEVYPLSWLFFLAFILISTFTMLNLFIAVVVTSMQNEHARELEDEHTRAVEAEHARIEESENVEAKFREDLHNHIAALHDEVRELRAQLQGLNDYRTQP